MWNTRSAYPANRVSSRRAHVGEAENTALELEVREQVRQAEVLVGVLAAEHLPMNQ